MAWFERTVGQRILKRLSAEWLWVHAKENLNVKNLKMYRKNMIRLFVSERLWQITEMKITNLVNLPLYFIANYDIKNFWKIPKWQGVKNLTSIGGRKQRFYISFRYLKSAWRWNLPTPFFYFQNRYIHKKYKIQISE